MTNMTIFKWLNHKYPKINSEWLQYKKELRLSRIRAQYKSTGRPPGRPKKS